MESPITMGEAGDNVCKDKTEHTDDGVCVNGNLDCGEPMEVCEEDSKAPEVNSNKIDSLKNCEKVPENKVPTTSVETDNEEPMDVDDTPEEENGAPQSDVDDDDKVIEGKIIEETTETHDTDHEPDSEPESVKSSSSKLEKDVENNAVNGTSSDNSVNGTTGDADASKVIPQKDKNTIKSNSADLNDSGDVVLVENDSEHKENGDVCSSPDVQEVISVSDKDTANSSADVINLVSPTKKKKKQSIERISDPPRRSSRNLNKQKSYVEKEDDLELEPELEPEPEPDPDPDVEEVTPEDPLADPLRDDKENRKKSVVKQPAPQQTSSTIVVSDTKRLVEIAANSKSSNSSGKKEPTLVIIDTNSILSGRGPVPVSHKPSPLPASFSMMPVALPAQGVYPPNMRATITPIPMSGSTSKAVTVTPASTPTITTAVASPTPAPAPAPAPILPTLTDDMYVVEAPSFIVPYVYEKPPIKPFRDFVSQIQKDIEEQKKLDAEKKKEEDEKSESEPKKSDDEDEEDDAEDSDSEEKKNKDEDKSKSKKDSKDDDVDKEKNSEEKDSDKKDEKKDEAVLGSSKEESSKTIDLDDMPDDSSKPKSSSYFDNALGQFFINIGYGLVQEFVQTDLLKLQKRKQNREGTAPETKMAITSLIKNLEYSKENNEPYKMEQRRCEFCSFKTESNLVLSHHLETPHMRNYVYKCNFCTVEVRSPHDILFHMEAEHNTRGRLERAPAFHQCPNCPFEDNQKGKLSRHLVTCVKKFKPERNLEPPIDWEPPAKIPRVPRVKQQGLSATAATYQALAQAKGNYQLFSKLQQAASPQNFPRGRGRPSLMGKVNSIRPQTPLIRTANMMYRPGTAGGSVLVPTYQFGGNQIFQVVGGQSELGVGGRLSVSGPGAPTSAPVALVPNLTSTQSTVTIQNSSGTKSSSGKVVQQPSISITPLPRQPATSSTTITKTSGSSSSASAAGDPSSSKATFVICEICDGYIKDLEQLRNHMQWIHKVKIHPKMIYNRPPLNCQKCQFRFFTDQGLERHLLGSHGLVTSSMQEAANKSKDAGRCPVCGRVYQWKLLNHVARDHNMTLKPAHLSYKCTVCTATFGMYKQFENHVYSAHSVVAKRVMEKKSSPSSSGASPSSSGATVTAATISARTGDSLLKPLKINDEITIIPQPAKSSSKSSTAGGMTATRASVTTGK